MNTEKFLSFLASKDTYAIILRGIHGSGKSALADRIKETLASKGKSCKIVSFDDQFKDDRGNYKYDASHHERAVQSCFNDFLDATEEFLVYDNVNIRAVDIAPFVMAASSADTPYGIVTVHTDLQSALEKNRKRIPDSKILDSLRDLNNEVFPSRWHRFEILPEELESCGR